MAAMAFGPGDVGATVKLFGSAGRLAKVVEVHVKRKTLLVHRDGATDPSWVKASNAEKVS